MSFMTGSSSASKRREKEKEISPIQFNATSDGNNSVTKD